MGRAWTEGEVQILREMTEAGYTAEEIAQRLGRTTYSVECARRQHHLHQRLLAPQAPAYAGEVTVEGDILVLADLHIPCQDTPFIERVVELALRWRVPNLGIAGDLVDFEAVSDWQHYGDRAIPVTQEIEMARRTLEVLSKEFERVVYCAGNHERRLIRRLDAVDTLREAMGLWTPDQIDFTDYQWFRVISGGVEYLVEHPRNVSVVPTRVAHMLAVKYNRNVIAGHGHLWGMTRDVSGRLWAIDSGAACDPKRLAWANKVHGTRPAMLQGAVIVRGGIPVLLSPDNLAVYEQ